MKTRWWLAMVIAIAIVMLLASACKEGPRGATGPMGANGLQGPKGDKGDTGLQGPQGIQGPQGVEGPIGAKGLQGERGLPGAMGAGGNKGDTGPQGLQGVPGSKGDKGDRGVTPSKDELITLIKQVLTPTPTPTPVPGSYLSPQPLFVFNYTTRINEKKNVLDVFQIADPVWGYPGCPKGAEIFGQGTQGDSVRCRIDHSSLLEWIQKFSLEVNLPKENTHWGVYAMFAPYQGPWPVPNTAQGPMPRFLVRFSAFEGKSEELMITVFPKGKDPSPFCPAGADKEKTETESYACVASLGATVEWLSSFAMIKILPPQTDWGKTYAVFPALFSP